MATLLSTIAALRNIDPPPDSLYDKGKSKYFPVEWLPCTRVEPYIELPGPVGPKTDEMDDLMHAFEADSAVSYFPKCATRSLEDWMAELNDSEMAFYMLRPQFIGKTGIMLMRFRQKRGIRRSALAKRSGLTRVTISEIESGHRDGGSSLEKIQAYLAGCDRATLHVRIYPHGAASKDVVPRALQASDDASLFAANLVRDLRRAAGLTQAQLNDRLRLPAALDFGAVDLNMFRSDPTAGATRISRIENLVKADDSNKRQRSVRLGTLFSIAYFCGYVLELNAVEARSKP